MDRVVHVGLLGFGTVGTGVIRILQDNAALIAQRAGAAIKIKKILVRVVGAPCSFAANFICGNITYLSPSCANAFSRVDLLLSSRIPGTFSAIKNLGFNSLTNLKK